MQKFYYFLFVLIFSTGIVPAQKSEVGFTLSMLSNNLVTRFNNSGDISEKIDYSAGKSVTFGLTFVKPMNAWLDLETGIEYLKTYASYNRTVFFPNYSEISQTSSVSLIEIPVGIRINFLKYCFVNGGLILEYDETNNSPIGSQTGLGSMLGAGLKYDFKTGISIFVNPYIKVHSLIPVVDFNSTNPHLLESAIRFGVTYHL